MANSDLIREARAIARELKDRTGVVVSGGHMSLLLDRLAAALEAQEWQPIHTRPECDDLMWFCRGDTVDGPRIMKLDDADYWDWWCYCESPPLPASQDNGE